MQRLTVCLVLGLLAVASLPAIALASHVGPAGSLHIEIATHPTPPSAEAFDFESMSYVAIEDGSADIRLGTDPISGYQQLLGLNGGVGANLGLVDFQATGCEDAASATFLTQVDTTVNNSITLNTVFLVTTGTELLAKLNLTEIDFSAPNGLAFDYELLDCSQTPTPTPTPTPAPTATPVPTASPEPTPLPTAAPAGLPATGGAPNAESWSPGYLSLTMAVVMTLTGAGLVATRRMRS